MNDELLPCPFCGCRVWVDSNRDWHRLDGNHDEACIFIGGESILTVPATDKGLALIISDWNRRTAPPPTAEVG